MTKLVSLLSRRPSGPMLLIVGLLLAGPLLTACAGMSDETAATLYSDPSTFEFFDCKQLETARTANEARGEVLRKLIAKAETGFAGSLVSTIAYQDDYERVRARAQRINEAWRKQKCGSAGIVAPSDTAPQANPARGGIY